MLALESVRCGWCVCVCVCVCVRVSVVGVAISRVKRDFLSCWRWECDIENVFSVSPPSYKLTLEHMPESS